jgi:hypothetical protein
MSGYHLSQATPADWALLAGMASVVFGAVGAGVAIVVKTVKDWKKDS